MIRTVLGADPGLTTGLARFDLDEFRPPVLLQVAAAEASAAVVELLGAQDPTEVLLAIEEFVVGHRAGRSSTPAGGRTARRLIGELDGLAADRDMPVRIRPAGVVKPWATDKRLRVAGLYQRGMPHARDGGRHALFAACNDCGLPDPLSRTYPLRSPR